MTLCTIKSTNGKTPRIPGQFGVYFSCLTHFINLYVQNETETLVEEINKGIKSFSLSFLSVLQERDIFSSIQNRILHPAKIFGISLSTAMYLQTNLADKSMQDAIWTVIHKCLHGKVHMNNLLVFVSSPVTSRQISLAAKQIITALFCQIWCTLLQKYKPPHSARCEQKKKKKHILHSLLHFLFKLTC